MNRRTILAALALLCAALASAATSRAQEVSLGGARPKMATVSAVRVRREPRFESAEVARLKLGTVVSAVARSEAQTEIGGRTDYWYRVELPGGVSGWAFGGLLADYDPARRPEIMRRVIDERLKVEAMEFEDGVDFYNFVASALAEAKEPEARGELERARLRAIGFAAGPMPEDAATNARYRDFQRAHAGEIFYHELAGGWYVRADAVWELERKYHGTPLGDSIAWDAAQAVLGGECESDEVCQFLRLSDTEGRYLSLYPEGEHAAEVLQNLAQALASEDVAQTINGTGGDQYQREARESLKKAVAELRPAVSRTKAPERAAVLERLNQLSPAGR